MIEIISLRKFDKNSHHGPLFLLYPTHSIKKEIQRARNISTARAIKKTAGFTAG